MPAPETVGLTLLIFTLYGGLLAVALGLPGTVFIFLATLTYAITTQFQMIGWKTLFVLLILVFVSEGIEFLLGEISAMKTEISRRGVAAAFTGALAGAVLLAPALYGLGILLGWFLGSYFGILMVETARIKRLRPVFRPGFAAVSARIAGTMIKGSLAMVMIAVALINIYS